MSKTLTFGSGKQPRNGTMKPGAQLWHSTGQRLTHSDPSSETDADSQVLGAAWDRLFPGPWGTP